MPEFDDVSQPPHYRPQLEYSSVAVIDRYTVLLKDGETTATIYPIYSVNELPPGLLAFLCDEFNMEIERGETYPFFDTLHIESFQNYWFGSFAAVMVLGDSPNLESTQEWEKECLGTFFIKPNYAGRCSHICTAGFLVNAGIRGKGIGRTLTDCYLQWAPRLGYTYSVFNLVFETNVAARRIWESLNFKRLGRVKSAGILKGHDRAVDALIYGRELVNTSDPAVGAYRFDKIKFYLETGKYPAMADRQEKSRLRSSASHYRLIDGKLLLKGREVISDPVRQLQICTEVHMTNHGGINKTTSVITEKYHWTRIKDTVATAIKNCHECRESAKEPPLHKQQQLHQQQRPLTPKKHAHEGLNRRKLLHQNQNSRAMLNRPKPTNTNDVEAMVALHSLPHHQRDDNLLSTHDLSGLDDGLIAVVEAAQKQQQQQQQLQQQQRQQHHQQQATSHHSNHENAPTYAVVAAAAVSGDSANQFHQYSNYDDDNNNDDDDEYREDHQSKGRQIPVATFDSHVGPGGDEIEIARALMQSNHEEQDEDIDDRNLKSDDHRRPTSDENIYFKN